MGLLFDVSLLQFSRHYAVYKCLFRCFIIYYFLIYIYLFSKAKQSNNKKPPQKCRYNYRLNSLNNFKTVYQNKKKLKISAILKSENRSEWFSCPRVYYDAREIENENGFELTLNLKLIWINFEFKKLKLF